MFHAVQGLSLIRIAFGLYFVVSAWRKTTSGWLTSRESMAGFITRNLEGSAAGYRGFVECTVLPNADRFSPLIVLGEWVAGLSLLFRLLARWLTGIPRRPRVTTLERRASPVHIQRGA